MVPIYMLLERVMEPRNQVAHPKTKSYKPDDVVTFNDPTIKTARQSVADMKRFLVLFRELLPYNFHATLGKRRARQDSNLRPAG